MRVAMFEGYDRGCGDERVKARLRAFDKAIGRNACGKALRRLLSAHAEGRGARAIRGRLANARQVFRNMCRVSPRYPIT